jgi:hypothetical protein
MTSILGSSWIPMAMLSALLACATGCGSSSGGTNNGGGGSGGSGGSGGGSSAGCVSTGMTGTANECTYEVSAVPGFSCTDGAKEGSCPAANLVGCCESDTPVGGYSTTVWDCYYDQTSATSGKADCMSTGQSWSTSLPPPQ